MSSSTDKEVAYKILLSLCESTYAKDLQEYKYVIQRDLNIPEEQFQRLFDYKILIQLLNPDKTYKGKSIYSLDMTECVSTNNSITPVSPLSTLEENDN